MVLRHKTELRDSRLSAYNYVLVPPVFGIIALA